jgi:hypothetical protein
VIRHAFIGIRSAFAVPQIGQRMMESTIGGVLLDVWFKDGGQQKTMAATSDFILSKLQIHSAKGGLNRRVTRAVRGAISFNSSIHLPPIAGSLPVKPVMLPLGCARLASNRTIDHICGEIGGGGLDDPRRRLARRPPSAIGLGPHADAYGHAILVVPTS